MEDIDRLASIFERVLWAYPPEFRRLFAQDMAEHFRRRCGEILSSRGRGALFAFALLTMTSVAWAALRERLEEGRRRGNPSIRKEGVMRGPLPDLVQAATTLRKMPAFTTIVVATLGLGIGVNATIASLISALLLSELPVRDPHNFVFLFGVNERAGENRTGLSLPEVAELRRSAQSFETVGLAMEESFLLTAVDSPKRVTSFRVTDDFFELWGVGMTLGRGFLPGEDRPGAAPIALLSHGFWERELGSDPAIVGSSLHLDGRAHTVVGVVSERMEFGDISRVDVWVPLGLELETARRDERVAFAQARLRPGVSREEAQRECEIVAARLRQEHPENTGWSFRVSPIEEQILKENDRILFVVTSVSVGLVLLIACVNVANMLMARFGSRSKEIAVRIALGAGRLRILRQLAAEALLLAVGGALVGLALARGLLDLLVFLTARRQWIFDAAEIDLPVLVFTTAVSMSTPLLFALVPSLKASRPNLTSSLREGSRAGTGRVALRSRGLLVAAQVAMALTLMVVTALLARRIGELKAEETLGYRTEGVLAVSIEVPRSEHEVGEKLRRFYGEVLARSVGTKGVIEASLVNPVPLSDSARRRNLQIEGRTASEDEESPSAYFFTAAPGYLSVMSIPLLRGRDFAPTDDASSPSVALVNEALAERYFAGEDPLGRRIRLASDSDGESWCEIVGIVGDVAHYDDELPRVPQVYLPLSQAPRPDMVLLVRAAGDPAALAEPIREHVSSLATEEAIARVETLDELRDEVFASADAIVALFVVFAVFALLMASMGVYGVMSFAVSQRERELGIRMALGADRKDVLRMIVLSGAKLVLAGSGAGFVGAALLGRMLQGAIVGLTVFDPVTFLAVTIVLVLVALAANWAPARRATEVDPIATLRAE